MREILFRGKRIDNREWTEGSLLKVSLTGFANTSIEIIGNIHDNPELLEATDG